MPVLQNKLKMRRLRMITIELTTRCNNNCKHCFTNKPIDDTDTLKHELDTQEIAGLLDWGCKKGALLCFFTGGEPLIRRDFKEIYLYAKTKGFLIGLMTNTTCVTEDVAVLFKKYPPRDIEVTVYGATRETYEAVTRTKGSFEAFMRGVSLFQYYGIPVRYKAMIIKTNLAEFDRIVEFCEKRTKDYFRFDPFLYLRSDRDTEKNKKILKERLTVDEICGLERRNKNRIDALVSVCRMTERMQEKPEKFNIFRCEAGSYDCAISYDGKMKTCQSMNYPGFIYDIHKGSLEEGWSFILSLRGIKSRRRLFSEKCGSCKLFNLCTWCPAHSYLENGKIDMPVDFFCRVAKARYSTGLSCAGQK